MGKASDYALALLFGRDRYEDNERLEIDGVSVYKWGTDNKEPDEILFLYNNSPLNQGIIDHKINALIGGGLEVPNGDLSQLEDLSVPNPHESWDELLLQMATNQAIFGGFALEVIYNALGDRIVEVRSVPMNYVRNRGIGDNRVELGYAISPDWSKAGSRKEAKSKPQVIAPFDTSKGKEDGKQLLVWYPKKPNQRYYPRPNYLAARNYIEADINNGTALSNFTHQIGAPAWHASIDADSSTESSQRQLNRMNKRIGEILTDQKNAGGLITTPSFVTLNKLEPPTLSDAFSDYVEIIDQKIITSHQIPSDAILGYGQEGKLGATNEMNEGYRLFIEMYVNPNQNVMLNQLSRVFSFNADEKVQLMIINKNIENDENANNTTISSESNPENQE